jgi:hypothetical protein
MTEPAMQPVTPRPPADGSHGLTTLAQHTPERLTGRGVMGQFVVVEPSQQPVAPPRGAMG